MQRDTFVVRQTFLQWLHKRSNPGRIVNLCFLIVLVFSTLLTWREVVVLEEAYISSQRNHLDTVASSLDRQLQNSVDRMLLFRQGMHDAIETPLAFDVLQDAVSRFNTVRMLPTWQLAVDKKRTFPINGVSDAFVDKTTLLNRDAERISHEISAALEVGYLLRLASSRVQTEDRTEGEYQLYDTRLNMIATSAHAGSPVNQFDERETAQIAQAIEHDTGGGIRLGSRFITWERLDHFDGVVLRIHTLHEGVQDDFGSISIVLALLWALFTAMLLISWLVIRRMVSNMYTLQHSLQWQAWHDPLTRLNNRGALFDRAKLLAETCRQQSLPFSVIQIDLDYFKNINDRFGHQAGDKVLSHTAGVIASALRKNDVAGRVGGEEFCVVLPGLGLEEARGVAERIRCRINSKEILVKKSTTLRISASLGVSSADETGNYDFEQPQSVADARLYQAKQSGRNRVVWRDQDRK